MATVTLVEASKLTQDMLLAGVIEQIIEVNPMFELFPFMEIEGNALSYNREATLGDVQFLGVGGTITAKNPATFTKKSASLTSGGVSTTGPRVTVAAPKKSASLTSGVVSTTSVSTTIGSSPERARSSN